MEVQVSLATTGEQVYSTAFLEVQDRHVWELRLQICRELSNVPYFSCVLFREQDLLDDTATLGAYMESGLEGVLHMELIIRELRPPTNEERRTIISCIEFHHRSLLWSLCHEECR